MRNQILYGDILLIKFSPALQMGIADVLETWILELMEKEDFDLTIEQHNATQKIIGVLAQHQAQEQKNKHY